MILISVGRRFWGAKRERNRGTASDGGKTSLVPMADFSLECAMTHSLEKFLVSLSQEIFENANDCLYLSLLLSLERAWTWSPIELSLFKKAETRSTWLWLLQPGMFKSLLWRDNKIKYWLENKALDEYKRRLECAFTNHNAGYAGFSDRWLPSPRDWYQFPKLSLAGAHYNGDNRRTSNPLLRVSAAPPWLLAYYGWWLRSSFIEVPGTFQGFKNTQARCWIHSWMP